MYRWIALSLCLLVPVAPVSAAVPWNQDAQQCFELTLPESFQPDKALPHCERAMTDPALTNRNLGGMYYYRGTIWNSKRDYKKALEDFKKASELDPVLPQARSYLGFTRFFLGDFKPAIYDFAAAYELRNDDIYAMVWLYIVMTRTGNDGRATLSKISKDVKFEEWPGPIVEMFLGRLTPQELVKLAKDPNPARQREKQCEAYFYGGQQLLIEGKKGEATKMFKAAMTTNMTKFVEYEGARFELQRLAGGK
jgi:lipoprotein NlpI